jgi:hypothetical protein
MQYIMSEGEAQYMDQYKGRFSYKLAEWAISSMKKKDENSGVLKQAPAHSIQEMEELMRQMGLKIKEEDIYSAWYLYNMCYADYSRALPNKQAIAYFIYETIYDPDCTPEAVLACFRAKMDVMDMPIYWERMI